MHTDLLSFKNYHQIQVKPFLISNFIYLFVLFLLFKLDLLIFLYLIIFFRELILDLSNNFKIIIICAQFYYLVQFSFGLFEALF